MRECLAWLQGRRTSSCSERCGQSLARLCTAGEKSGLNSTASASDTITLHSTDGIAAGLAYRLKTRCKCAVHHLVLEAWDFHKAFKNFPLSTEALRHCRVAPLRAAPCHSATCCQLCIAPPRCCRAASLLPRRFATATPQPVPLTDALEPVAVVLLSSRLCLCLCLCLCPCPCLCLCLCLCLGSPRGFCSHGWWRAKRRCASLVLDGYWFDVLAEWNMLCILKLMLHVQHRVWLLGAFVLLSGKHMSFVLLALDLARSF